MGSGHRWTWIPARPSHGPQLTQACHPTWGPETVTYSWLPRGLCDNDLINAHQERIFHSIISSVFIFTLLWLKKMSNDLCCWLWPPPCRSPLIRPGQEARMVIQSAPCTRGRLLIKAAMVGCLIWMAWLPGKEEDQNPEQKSPDRNQSRPTWDREWRCLPQYHCVWWKNSCYLLSR